MTVREAIADLVPDGSSVVLGLQMEQMIPFAAGHEIIRQKKRGLTLIGPISDILFDQLIAAGCVERVIAAWVGNVMMGSAYNFRRGVEQGELKVVNLSNFTVALALQAAAMGVPFLPTRSALGSDVARDNDFLTEIDSPFEDLQTGKDRLHAVRALTPNVAIVHLQRADSEGNAHCWGNFGVMIEAVRAAKRVIVLAEEIVDPEVISSDPNRTVIPGFLVNAVDNAFFRQYHEQTKTKADSEAWFQRWVHGVADRKAYMNQLGGCRVEELGVKQHAYAARTDFGY